MSLLEFIIVPSVPSDFVAQYLQLFALTIDTLICHNLVRHKRTFAYTLQTPPFHRIEKVCKIRLFGSTDEILGLQPSCPNRAGSGLHGELAWEVCTIFGAGFENGWVFENSIFRHVPSHS